MAEETLSRCREEKRGTQSARVGCTIKILMAELYPRAASARVRGWPHSNCSHVGECRLSSGARPRDTAMCAPKPKCGPPHMQAKTPAAC